MHLAARRGDVISVQIDGLDHHDDTWSVMVTGIDGSLTPDEVRTERIVDRGTSLVALPLLVVTGQTGP